MNEISDSKVLIVDDNDMNREICGLHLEDLGVQVLIAENGQEGIDSATKHLPDLILLDIMMPVLNGFQMLELLRQDPLLKNIPVLMLTAKTETDSVVKALELGANDYLRKPFEGEELLARSKTLLKTRLLEKQAASDLEAGAKIQKKFLTDEGSTKVLFNDQGFDISIFDQSAGSVSGDFYYSFLNNDGNLCLFTGDSCGHGLPAALISIRITGYLQTFCSKLTTPSDVLDALNQDLIGLMPSGKFIACNAFVFDNNQVCYSNASQPYPILIKPDSTNELVSEGLPVGLDKNRFFVDTKHSFNDGDYLVIYTDGLTEAINNNEEIYSKERLLRCLEAVDTNQTAADINQMILSDVYEFVGSSIFDDDVSLMIVKKNS